MNHFLDRIQILCSGSLDIFNDLISFWKECIKNKIADDRHFEKIATWKACGCDILWIVGWIAFIFDEVALQACLMIWLPFENNSLKIWWLIEDILETKCFHAENSHI